MRLMTLPSNKEVPPEHFEGMANPECDPEIYFENMFISMLLRAGKEANAIEQLQRS